MQQPPPGPPEGPMEPPPVPPPSQPPASQPAPMGAAAASNSKLYTVLAWVLFPPIGSIIFLFVGKDDPDVKFNAANATAVHGAMLVVWIILRILAAPIGLFGVLLFLWGIVWFIVWVIGLVLSLQSNGRRFSFPVLTDALSGVIPTIEGLAQ